MQSQFDTGLKLITIEGKAVHDSIHFDETYNLYWSNVLELISGEYRNPAVSPDESRIAVERDGDIWLLGPSRGAEQKLTFDSADDFFPIWSPDGDRIVFGSNREGRPFDLYVKDAAGASPERLLLATDSFKLPFGWSTNGAFVT